MFNKRPIFSLKVQEREKVESRKESVQTSERVTASSFESKSKTVQTSEHAVRRSVGQSGSYRVVNLENIPIPTSGGVVTGKLILPLCFY